MSKTNTRVLLLMAMRAEAQPIIDALGLHTVDTRQSDKLPFLNYENDYQGLNIRLVVSGYDHRFNVDNIGMQAATLMAYTSVIDYQPDIVINAGTAGGFKQQGAKVGSIFLSADKFIFHDRRVPLPGFDQSAIGHYPAFDVRHLADALGFGYGVISSGSSLEKSEQDLLVLAKHNAVAKEMEAAAIAWVCWLHEQPFFAIKSITNLLDESNTSEQEFVNNLKTASTALQKAVLKVLDYLAANSLTS